MKRTFIAVRIHPGEKMREIISFIRQMLSQEKIKWVDPEIMHITIAFLGDTDEKIITPVKGIIQQVTQNHLPFELVFTGAGVFKNLRDPRVIWIGTETNQFMQSLKAGLDNELSRFGFEKEIREFRPHLTLGRIKWIKNVSALEEAIKPYKDQEVQRELISEIIYYESILKPEGPVYLPLLSVPLKKKD